MKVTKDKTMHFVWKAIICKFGILHTIVFDNGRKFDNLVFREFYSDLGIVNLFHLLLTPKSTDRWKQLTKSSSSILKLGLKT